MKLTLSISKAQPKTKAEGNPITEFVVKEFEVIPTSDLRELFTTRVYSTNYWEGGHCKKEKYKGMYGITFDIDQDFSIERAKEEFKDVNYIIHTSTSHRADLPKKGGIQDRFRIILPADPSTYEKYSAVEKAYAMYTYLIDKYPYIDPACGDAARKYFPYLNAAYPQLFELYINETGNYFSVPDIEIDKYILSGATGVSATRQRFNEFSQYEEPGRSYIHLDDEVLVPDGIKMKIRDITEPTPCKCLFHDDSHLSAWITFSTVGRHPILKCATCTAKYGKEVVFGLPLDEQYNNIFYVGDKLTELIIYPDRADLSKVPLTKFNHLDKDSRDKLLNWLANNRLFSTQSFAQKTMVDGYAEKLRYNILPQYNYTEVFIPPTAAKIADNAYIDRWLDEMFKEYSGFIKDWLALYCYANYIPLPVIVLQGIRGSGKNTFAEFVQSIYPSLTAQWEAKEDTRFTDFFEKHLLIVDEANIDKKEQYLQLKKVSGSAKLPVEHKYLPTYYVQNNVAFIIMTNAVVPLYLVATEKPATGKYNQFFMYQVPLPKELNSLIKDELEARVGHYVRTELRSRYERWLKDGIQRKNRYSLEVPMTPFQEDQYANSRSSIDYDSDRLYKVMLKGQTIKDKQGAILAQLGPYAVVTSGDLKELLKHGEYDNKNTKAIKERLQALGYLRKNVLRVNGQDAWEVVPEDELCQ
jgi:Family of unknown function (DUF5906)